MEVTTATGGGLYEWILQYGQVIAFFAQLLYWTLMVLFLGYAVAIYKTYTNYQMGRGKSGEKRAEAEKAADVAVDKFVE